jgi:hypothetical protein
MTEKKVSANGIDYQTAAMIISTTATMFLWTVVSSAYPLIG